MTSLEELKMSDNNLGSDGSLNDKMDTLTLLKKLDLSNCRLSEIPSSIYRMVSLEELDFKGNRLLHQTLNRESLHIQTPLKKLNISDCRLTEIPPSIYLMVSLEELDLSHNNLSSDKFISEKLFSLTSVKRLILRSCKLPEIPRSISLMKSLEELDLSHNNLSSDTSISEKLPSLTSVRRLDLQCCHLTEIPKSVRQLVCLRRIDLSENYLETLPWSVFCLPFIELIDLTGNGNLKRLGSSKFEMSKLQKLPKLVLEDCYQLRQPPLQICLQGTEAILNYYTAMGKDESGLLSLLTVGVLGESFSGKTSVVKSLKHGKRILTQRSKTSRKDETTVVFNQETVDIHGGKSDIRFINFGGNGVYHPAYKLALRSNFIPALVVNIKRYMDLSMKSGCVEATRRLCFDWLAHFYLTDHKLGRPLLVLTHKDKLSDNQEQQKKLTNEYRDILLETVARLQRISNMMVFEDKAKSIFEDVFIVGNDDSFDEFQRLLQCIDNRTNAYLYEVPDAWKSTMKKIEDSKEPYLEIEDLKSEFTDSTSLFVMLRFMHRSGRILWLEDLSEEISTKIFHKIQEVARTIAILFNHNDKWEQRKEEYMSVRDEARGDRVGDAELSPMIYRYLKTGMIDERLLSYLISTESNLSVEVSLSLMKSFLLIYGPIQQKDDIYYAVPYCSTTYTNNQWRADGDIRLRLSLSLDSSYALPQHAYHQMSLLLASLDCNQKSSLELKRNGATIYHEGWKTHFIYDHNNSAATLQASTSVEKLTESWTILRTTVSAILDFLSVEWEAVRPRCIFYCGSCILTDQLRPEAYVSPFLRYETVSDECSGAEMVYCEEESCDVPACLVRPCYSMSADELESLRSYIHHHLYVSTTDSHPVALTEDSVSLCIPAQPTQRDETWETPQELDDLMKNTADADIILTPHQTPEYLQELYFNTDRVYPMSGGKRGRALIMSNQYSSYPRRGAEQDFINLKRMFESFNFDVVGEHKDYTAQEIYDTIVRETEDRRHHRNGLFALVITSHGSDGLVYGNDDYSIRLSDIYGLLSASKFPAMAGKPKLIVIEACSGGMMDAPAELAGYKTTIARTISKPPITVSTAHDQRQGGSRRNIDRHSSGQTSEAASDTSSSLHTEPNLSMDHLMILRSSLTGFGSIRHPANGSWMIRALVIAFYKHGHWRDLEELCVIARNQVRLMSIATSEERGEARGQIPDLTCTFTNGRSVYLFPGFHG